MRCYKINEAEEYLKVIALKKSEYASASERVEMQEEKKINLSMNILSWNEMKYDGLTFYIFTFCVVMTFFEIFLA